LAAILALFLLAFVLTACAYSIVHIHHHCTGDDCPICHNIRALWALLTDIARVALLVGVIFLVHFSLISFSGYLPGLIVARLSPVRLFDRMND